MKYGVYACKDELVGYDRPLIFDNDNVAIRNFGTALEDPDAYFSKFPADFSLWRIANYDSDTGVLTPESPQKICDALQFMKRKENVDV